MGIRHDGAFSSGPLTRLWLEWGCSLVADLGEQTRSYLIDTQRAEPQLPQGLKPASLLASGGATERRALPERFILAKQRLKA
jgi:hypothetical protein